MSSMFAIAVMLLGVVVAGLWSQWRFIRTEGAFRCKIRACGGPSGLGLQLPPRWPRHLMLARWSGGVLVVRRGLVFTHHITVSAQVSENGVRNLPSWDPGGCGRRPLAVELLLPDGSCVELAAPETARRAMVGPYLSAAVHGLPTAPLRRSQGRRQD
jgi:hypothetical protein